jgi:Lipocalin-like domain
LKILLTSLLLLSSALAQSAAPAAAPAEIAHPTVKNLLGTWRLVSIDITKPDGSVQHNPKFGPHARGFIMYQPDGFMCAEIMDPDRMSWKDPQHPTSNEKLATYDSMLSYCGTYKLDSEHSTLTHHPSVAWSSTFLGIAQPRPFRIVGNRLIINPPNPGPDVTNWVLTWERVDAPAKK